MRVLEIVVVTFHVRASDVYVAGAAPAESGHSTPPPPSVPVATMRVLETVAVIFHVRASAVCVAGAVPAESGQQWAPVRVGNSTSNESCLV